MISPSRIRRYAITDSMSIIPQTQPLRKRFPKGSLLAVLPHACRWTLLNRELRRPCSKRLFGISNLVLELMHRRLPFPLFLQISRSSHPLGWCEMVLLFTYSRKRPPMWLISALFSTIALGLVPTASAKKCQVPDGSFDFVCTIPIAM
jgi:hypothetical protein